MSSIASSATPWRDTKAYAKSRSRSVASEVEVVHNVFCTFFLCTRKMYTPNPILAKYENGLNHVYI